MIDSDDIRLSIVKKFWSVPGLHDNLHAAVVADQDIPFLLGLIDTLQTDNARLRRSLRDGPRDGIDVG